MSPVLVTLQQGEDYPEHSVLTKVSLFIFRVFFKGFRTEVSSGSSKEVPVTRPYLYVFLLKKIEGLSLWRR